MDYIAFLQCIQKGMNMSEITASMHISRPAAYEIRSFLEGTGHRANSELMQSPPIPHPESHDLK